ncbi:MAG: superoxide dismutase family protein [Pseudomonadota bacterium]|nr:superoxide dismutase family protein [Pseudomonadota bacterium]
MTHAFRTARWSAAFAALALAACNSMPAGEPSGRSSASANANANARSAKPVLASMSTVREATVNLAPASGSLVSGRLTLRPMGDGVHLTGEIGGLPRNSTHAIHIHEKGDCTAADASSAGGHFNPTGEPHGRVGTPTHHAGDMNNILANTSGVAKVDVHAEGVVLGGSAANDAIGRAVVVHAQPDDYTSQPSGDAGARIACGMIRAQG